MAKDGQPQADFINCIAWGKSAEFVSKYVTEIVVEEVDFAGSRPKSESNKSDADDSETNEDAGFYPEGTDDELPF